MPPYSIDNSEHVTLCETLDRILHKGAVVVGEVMLSVADVDLIYLGLNIILTSVDTATIEIREPMQDSRLPSESSG
jgi:hypothetical protein